MAAGVKNLTIEQNSTWFFDLTWKDANDDPVDLTDWTARFQIRPHQTSDELILDLSTEAPGMDDTFIQAITLGGALGTISIEVDEDVVQALDFSGNARYDLVLEDTNDNVRRLLMGKVRLSYGVTRPV